MITRLQTFFLKHNKWLFSALLVVIIVTFVLTIGNQSFFGGNPTARVESREYYGYDLNNPEDLRQLGLHGAISAQLHPELGVQGPRIQQYAILRVSALGLANELNINPPGSGQLESYIESLPVFQAQTGEGFDQQRYQQFRTFVAMQMGGEGALAKVLREDYRIGKVREAFAGPGYVVPFSVQQNYAQSETSWEVKLAQRGYADFQPELEPDEEELRAFYQEDPGRFTVPERLEVSAVRFRAESFLDAVAEPSGEELEQYFNRYRFRYQEQPVDNEAEPAEVTLEAVRGEVLADYRSEQATGLAREASDRFATTLYEQAIERQGDAFADLLQEHEATVEPLGAYSRGNPPGATDIPANAFESMWIHVSGDRYFSDLVSTTDGAAILLLDERLPENIPPFEEVAAEVEEAWAAEERRRLFAESAQDWEAQIHEALANGATFEEAASDAGFAVTSPESFLGKDTPTELLRLQVAAELVSLEPQQASPVVISGQAAAMIHVESVDRPEVDSASEDFIAFLESELEARRANNGWAALNAWTDRTLQVSDPELASRD